VPIRIPQSRGQVRLWAARGPEREEHLWATIQAWGNCKRYYSVCASTTGTTTHWIQDPTALVREGYTKRMHHRSSSQSQEFWARRHWLLWSGYRTYGVQLRGAVERTRLRELDADKYKFCPTLTLTHESSLSYLTRRVFIFRCGHRNGWLFENGRF